MSKSPFFVNFHLIWSPFSVGGKLNPQVWRNSSTTPITQSFGSWIKWTFQLLHSSIPNCSRDEATDASLLVAIPYITEKVNWSYKSPHHRSVQNFTLSPTLTLNRIFLLKTPNLSRYFSTNHTHVHPYPAWKTIPPNLPQISKLQPLSKAVSPQPQTAITIFLVRLY